ncbi:ABC transporter permease [Lichenifustis flavocetrariae]|uniref:ABC transporter permease subunit n=1 Tax=Lichenifustis flavocetrariae TaxID=2949735 RepID=A0AA41YXG9_9HYPH|nr:ABC transporter permease subunit [Lichenifustis flavocetrariae]MCW6506640.1 ABC transporter permease subunit [Lichenifustis flavocetrariae]
MTKALSLAVLFAIWEVAALVAQSRLLPTPGTIIGTIGLEIRSGEMPFQFACTLGRVGVAFTVAFVLGTIIGTAMGRVPVVDRFFDPWVVILLNLPALVVIIFAYLWIGLDETAAIVAVVLNKLPNVIVTTREGARAMDAHLAEMAQVFRFSALKRLRHLLLPQLAPYLAIAARSGLSTVWKIVLVVELLGRPNGVGFVLGTSFSLFDVTKILAYALMFVALMLGVEILGVQPFERRAARWRPRRV